MLNGKRNIEGVNAAIGGVSTTGDAGKNQR